MPDRLEKSFLNVHRSKTAATHNFHARCAIFVRHFTARRYAKQEKYFRSLGHTANVGIFIQRYVHRLFFAVTKYRHCDNFALFFAVQDIDIIVGKINVDSEGALAATFGIDSIPTLVIVKGGEIAGKLVGLNSKTLVLSFIDKTI